MEKKGFLSTILRILPGFLMLAVTLYLLRTFVEPWMKNFVLFGVKGWLASVLSLNYILLAIIAGMFYRNVLFGGKIPAWAEDGFRTTRLFIKAGVIMLGSLYTVQNLLRLGSTAMILILSFVFGTLLLVLMLGKLFKANRSVTAVMGAACGVCGVSAAVATSPGVQAKPVDLALSVATILGFGILTMFISPFIGKSIGLSDAQFGAWVGTGILNSGQVLATCLAFNPVIAEGTAVYYGEIWNVIRVITIPFVVFVLSIWYWRGVGKEEAGNATQLSLAEIFVTKFPVFVLGFFGMTALSSLGWLGPSGSETLALVREFMQWIFGIGLVGLGAYIDVREIRAAGGAPLRIGLIAGTTKYLLALLIILLFVPKDGSF